MKTKALAKTLTLAKIAIFAIAAIGMVGIGTFSIAPQQSVNAQGNATTTTTGNLTNASSIAPTSPQTPIYNQ